MHSVYLLTGSNVGNSLANLTKASSIIEEQIGLIKTKSACYKTAPWGNTAQQDFLNQVLHVITHLTPAQLIKAVLNAEADMGRERTIKWAPRVIDIDVLFYDNEVINNKNLTVPHPLLHERRFTLIPLCEIAPDLIHPVLQQTMQQLLDICPDDSLVEKL